MAGARQAGRERSDDRPYLVTSMHSVSGLWSTRWGSPVRERPHLSWLLLLFGRNPDSDRRSPSYACSCLRALQGYEVF
jgi:hypothetical protein